jgi:hypothetical protein
LFVLAFLISIVFAWEEGKQSKRGSYAAVVVGTGGMVEGRTLNLNINIDQYTTDQQIQEFLTLLKEKGQDALRKELAKVKVGRIAPVATTGTDLSVARVFETEEGEITRLVTPRPSPFWKPGAVAGGAITRL